MDLELFIDILRIVGDKSAVFPLAFLSLFIYDKPASVKHSKLLRKALPAWILRLKIQSEKRIENPDRWD